MFTGGESYAECTSREWALCTKQWDSSSEQQQRVAKTQTALVDAEAWTDMYQGVIGRLQLSSQCMNIPHDKYRHTPHIEKVA